MRCLTGDRGTRLEEVLMFVVGDTLNNTGTKVTSGW